MSDREVCAALSRLDARFLRTECGFSRATVAAAFGVRPALIGRWETRSIPRGPALRRRYLQFNLGLARHLEIRES